MARVIRVTLGTNVLPASDLLALAMGRQIEFARVSVTDRELEGSNPSVQLTPFAEVPEAAVWNESHWGSSVWASAANSETTEQILRVIGNGSFPRERSRLSSGERRQLLDAMILAAHVRSRRDVFVTNDRRAFISDGRRQKLEALLRVRILTREEFQGELEPAASQAK
jgi:hypothetical protein